MYTQGQKSSIITSVFIVHPIIKILSTDNCNQIPINKHHPEPINISAKSLLITSLLLFHLGIYHSKVHVLSKISFPKKIYFFYTISVRQILVLRKEKKSVT